MLLAAILVLFSLLALGLLALLDRYDSAMIKAEAARQANRPQSVVYYDAFADRPQKSRATPPKGREDGGQAAA